MHDAIPKGVADVVAFPAKDEPKRRRKEQKIGRRHDTGTAAAHIIYRETLDQLRGEQKPSVDGKSAVNLFLRYVEQHAAVENVLLNSGASEETITNYTRDLLAWVDQLDRMTGGLYGGLHHD